jgi:hypothetical protein
MGYRFLCWDGWDGGDNWDILDRGGGDTIGVVGERGMIGDGIEAASGRDEFAGVVHALEHLASSFVAEEAEIGDIVSGKWSGIIFEHGEDQLALGREKLALIVVGVDGGGRFAEPVEIGSARRLSGDGKGERRSGGSKGMFGVDEETALVVVGIRVSDHEEGTVDGRDERESVEAVG